METVKIEVLLRAIELGSLTKAAEEYEYSPSAVSQMVTSLENEIGTRLIARTHSGITVAEGKEDIIRLLENIVKTKNRIMMAAVEKNKGKRSVTIATYASISKYILPNAVKKYKERFGDTDINIIVENNLDLIYKKGLADLFLGERIKCDGAVWEKIFTDPYVAVLPMSICHYSETFSREELLEHKFILADDKNISDYLKEAASEEIFKNNSSDDSSIAMLVKGEMGVSILSSLAVLGAEGISLKKLSPPLSRELGFSYNPKDFKEKRYLSDFTSILSEYIEENHVKK